MTPAERTLLERAIQKYGKDRQILKALEEMTELSHELWKIKKEPLEPIDPRIYDLNIQFRLIPLLEEIADVRIMLDQLEIMFGDTSCYRRWKLERLERRLNEN